MLWRILPVLCVVAFVSCESEKSSVPSTESQDFPTSEATNASSEFLTGSVVTTRIHSGRIVSYAERDSAWAYDLHVDFYDEEGTHTSTLTADSAYVKEHARFIEVHGEVHVVTDDGRTLDTDKLAWDDDNRRIYTDSYVEITRGEDTMAGTGFESDPELNHIKLRKQVTGTLTDTKTLEDTL